MRSSAIVADVNKHVPGSHLGIHTHNDTENAVANTLAAVRAGARQIQGALNGLGERCGNANLASIIPTLLLKSEFAERFETSVTPERLRKLTHASRLLDEILNRAPNRQAPYVGEAAFATKAGIHASRHPQGAGRPTSTCRPRASATGAACWCRTRPASRTCCTSWSGWACPSAGTTRASRSCSTR